MHNQESRGKNGSRSLRAWGGLRKIPLILACKGEHESTNVYRDDCDHAVSSLGQGSKGRGKEDIQKQEKLESAVPRLGPWPESPFDPLQCQFGIGGPCTQSLALETQRWSLVESSPAVDQSWAGYAPPWAWDQQPSLGHALALHLFLVYWHSRRASRPPHQSPSCNQTTDFAARVLTPKFRVQILKVGAQQFLNWNARFNSVELAFLSRYYQTVRRSFRLSSG